MICLIEKISNVLIFLWLCHIHSVALHHNILILTYCCEDISTFKFKCLNIDVWFSTIKLHKITFFKRKLVLCIVNIQTFYLWQRINLENQPGDAHCQQSNCNICEREKYLENKPDDAHGPRPSLAFHCLSCGGLRFGCTFYSVLTFSSLVIRPLTPFKVKLFV